MLVPLILVSAYLVSIITNPESFENHSNISVWFLVHTGHLIFYDTSPLKWSICDLILNLCHSSFCFWCPWLWALDLLCTVLVELQEETQVSHPLSQHHKSVTQVQLSWILKGHEQIGQLWWQNQHRTHSGRGMRCYGTEFLLWAPGLRQKT